MTLDELIVTTVTSSDDSARAPGASAESVLAAIRDNRATPPVRLRLTVVMTECARASAEAQEWGVGSGMTIGDANEPTLWEGTSQTLTGAATGGRAAARYRVAQWHLYFESGLITTNSQQVPLAQVRDVDVKQSMTQKARGLGDVIVHVTTQPAPVVMESVKDPKQVRDIVNRATAEARAYHQRQQTTQYHQGGMPVYQQPPGAQPAAATGGGLVEQLKELAALRDAGVLTEDEFAAQKARILG